MAIEFDMLGLEVFIICVEETVIRVKVGQQFWNVRGGVTRGNIPIGKFRYLQRGPFMSLTDYRPIHA